MCVYVLGRGGGGGGGLVCSFFCFCFIISGLCTYAQKCSLWLENRWRTFFRKKTNTVSSHLHPSVFGMPGRCTEVQSVRVCNSLALKAKSSALH